MKIYQIVDTLNFGDAIGNDVVAIKHVIEEMGIETEIYANSIAEKVKEPGAYKFSNMPKIDDDDIVIYHMASGSAFNKMTAELNCRKIMIYHNITPFEFFTIDSIGASEVCRRGLNDMLEMKGKFTAYLADSHFNKSNMIDMGYAADKIDVIPVIIPFDDYKKTPDADMVKKLSDGVTNIVFVGRIAPNKKHEDLIRTFHYYKKNVNPNSRLILAGSANKGGMYYNDLLEYIDYLGVEDVIFPGHISFAEILAIYSTADVFLCLSEHEGFCVPLLEAMTFDVPIVAFASSAIPETIGGASVVVDNKDPVYLSKVIDGVINNEQLKKQIIEAQRKRLEDFRYEKIKVQLQNYINDFMEKYPPLSPDDDEKGYRDIYNLVEKNMKSSGNSMSFSLDALLHSARRKAGEVDVTELLDYNYKPQSFIEASYISFFNRLPDKSDYEHWMNEASGEENNNFLGNFISFAVNSAERISKGIKIKFNPFTTAELCDENSEDSGENEEIYQADDLLGKGGITA